LITGGAQGLGAAAARRFVGDGFAGLMLLDRNGGALSSMRASLASARIRVESICADLADESVPDRVVSQTISAFGRLDVLVNAAGSTERCGVTDTTTEAFDRLFSINVKAPYFLMQKSAQDMLRRNNGVIVNVSSMLAYGGPPNLTTYSASKAALNVITRSAANTWKRQGIRVFGINLGWTLTEGEHLTQTGFHGLPEDWAEQIGARMPFGRLANADDVAAVISFLVSPAAGMMTGAIIDHEQMPAGTFDTHPALAI
jgi:NAD(P)-dependent dehydrogenase (short-subunit alcohol dehydrogenase family)